MDDCTLILKLNADIILAVLSWRRTMLMKAPVKHVAHPGFAAAAEYNPMSFRLHAFKILGVLSWSRRPFLSKSQIIFPFSFLSGSWCYYCIWSPRSDKRVRNIMLSWARQSTRRLSFRTAWPWRNHNVWGPSPSHFVSVVDVVLARGRCSI